MLTIAEVKKQFGGHLVLDGVSLSVGAGETCVLRAPNGTGKSTLCEIVAGVIDADAGSVTVEGRSIREGRARASIGYAPSAALLPDALHLHEWIDLVAALKGATATEVDEATERWGLEACTDARLSALSLGQRRRLALACAELGRPRLLLLDEPTVGLDDAGRALLVERLRRHVAGSGAALVATHDELLIGPLGARTVTLPTI